MPVAVIGGISVSAPAAPLAVEPLDGEGLAVESLDVEPVDGEALADEPLGAYPVAVEPPDMELCPVREACPVHPALLPEAEPSWEMPEMVMELICDSWAAIAAGIGVAAVTSLTDCESPAATVSGLPTLALMVSGAMPWP